MAALSAEQLAESMPAAEEKDYGGVCIKVEFEKAYNQGGINMMAVIRKVVDTGCKHKDPQAAFDDIHAFFKSIPHYFSYRGHNHVAVHMKMPNGLPQPVRQFLIIENKGE